MGTTVVAEEGDQSVRRGPEEKKKSTMCIILKHFKIYVWSHLDQLKENANQIANLKTIKTFKNSF